MNFPELLTSLGVPWATEGHNHCRPGWVQLDCPFCGRDSGKFHLGFNLDHGYLNCWQCRGHTLLSTLIELTGRSASDCRKLLEGLEIEPDGSGSRVEPEAERGRLLLPTDRGPVKGVVRHYLINRGFDPDVLERLWKIEALGPMARCQEGTNLIRVPWRVFIPMEHLGRVVSWTTRSISPHAERRYISAPPWCEELSGKRILYGEQHCGNAVCAVEGPIDVWGLGPGAVASLGTAFSRAQVFRLSKYPIRGVCYDQEREAQRRARDLVQQLSCFPGKTYNFVLQESKDPGAITPRERAQIRRALQLPD